MKNIILLFLTIFSIVTCFGQQPMTANKPALVKRVPKHKYDYMERVQNVVIIKGQKTLIDIKYEGVIIIADKMPVIPNSYYFYVDTTSSFFKKYPRSAELKKSLIGFYGKGKPSDQESYIGYLKEHFKL